jgi:hypothetical protein
VRGFRRLAWAAHAAPFPYGGVAVSCRWSGLAVVVSAPARAGAAEVLARANLGNTDRRFPGLLQDLMETRGTATYVDGKFNCDEPLARAQLEILLELRQHVQDILAGDSGQVIRVIATGDSQAGSLVSRADATIRPPKTPRTQRNS